MDAQVVAQFSAFQQIKKQYNFLRQLQPTHELLTLTDVSGSRLGITDTTEYRKRYVHEHTSSPLQTMIDYQFDLEKAVKGELEKKLASLGILEIAKHHLRG